MIAVVIGVIWLGYGLSAWGYALTQGWDIPAGQWWNVVHPYEYPPKGTAVPTVPTGYILPPGTNAAAQQAQGQGGAGQQQTTGNAGTMPISVGSGTGHR